jgi:hypothetical protein
MTRLQDPDHWHKSSRSGGADSCVEVAFNTKWAYVRDTKSRACGYLIIAPNAWSAFIASTPRSNH